VGMFRHGGSNTRRLVQFLKRRARLLPPRRAAYDRGRFDALFHKRAVVFTDTADFTTRTLRDGILHFLMVFDRAVEAASAIVSKDGGRIVKVEGDSLLLTYGDVASACRGVGELDRLLHRLNRGLPANERLRFSYGVGYGDLLDLDDDLFGLEVNLASKLGEDLARPGEALLTPAAGAAADPTTLRRLVPYKVVTFGKRAIPVQRLQLRRR
jgi:adenylate cyclase